MGYRRGRSFERMECGRIVENEYHGYVLSFDNSLDQLELVGNLTSPFFLFLCVIRNSQR